MDEKKLRQMKRYRIYRYGLFDHIFDVQVKKWYGWVLVKRFKADISSDDTMIDNIYYFIGLHVCIRSPFSFNA